MLLIIEDISGLTIKRTIEDQDYVRVGITQVSLWKNGQKRNVRDIGKTFGKPSCKFTINECHDLLVELEGLPS